MRLDRTRVSQVFIYREPVFKLNSRVTQTILIIFVGDTQSIEVTLSWFDLYSRSSGAVLNIDKCQGLWLGSWKSRTDSPFGFTWSASNKILGVHFSENSEFFNSAAITNKVKMSINMHNRRNLTLRGKTVIANNVILAKLWYIISVVNLPNTTIMSITKLLFNFIWNNHFSECISRLSAIRSRLEGGLGVLHIDTKIASLRCAYIKRFLDDEPKTWKFLTNYWIGLQLRSFKPSLFTNLIPHAEHPNLFHQNALQHFQSVFKATPQTTLNQLSSRLSYKSLLKSIVTPCNIISKFPLIDFSVTWRVLEETDMAPWPRISPGELFTMCCL